MDSVNRKVAYGKAGGSAGKDSTYTLIKVPKKMFEAIGVTVDDREVKVTLVEGKIIIEKI